MLKKFKQKLLFPIAKIAFDKYTSKVRSYTYENITVDVSPEVFPPKFTISTKLLLEHLKHLDLRKKSLLELGCGSGIISLYAASKGAIVTASDINTIAVNNLREASKKNDLPVKVVVSDLFKNLSDKNFDYIIINPPYYPKTPNNLKERAWFCGENFEYFQELFTQIPNQIAKNTLIILSEDCNISHIKKLAKRQNLQFKLIHKKKVKTEVNYIFKIENLN